MHVTLIKPNIGRMEHKDYIDEGRMEPLQLGVLAGMTPDHVEVTLYDDRIDDIDYDSKSDLVAITVETFTARRSYEIAAEYRKRGVPVILGGMHPTLLPEEASMHADSICIGDVESIWKTILDDVVAGSIQKRYDGLFTEVQPGTVPRRDLFKGKGYLPLSLIQWSRGCIHGCSFCATSAFFGATHRFRRIEEVTHEIKSQNLRMVFFVDDNIVADPEYAKELFRALIPLKIKWVSQASITMTRDPELMDLMMQSGCLGNVIGFESIDESTLEGMNKLHNAENFSGYREELAILRDYGMQVWAAFTIGHDQDTRDSIMRTLDFAIENRFCFAAFNIMMPYPGTPYYEKLRAEGRLLYDGRWWLHPEYRFNYAAFRPRTMEPDELTEIAWQCRRSFNSPGSIVKRALDFKTNMRNPYRFLIYCLYNPLFRKEVYKKQGMYFGQGKNPLDNEA
jgi:radical SAM superfamily enzyme YgiQ (UPF0313 family)